jgi:hypothetical protein
MEDQGKDIFDSDKAFLGFLSTFLLISGLVFLMGGLSCKVVHLQICRWELISVFAGIPGFNRNILMINFPLGMVILGGSLRLHSRFGWLISIAMLTFFSAIFAGLTAFLLSRVGQELNVALTQMGSVSGGSYLQAIITDFCFFILSAGCLLYLWLNPVRKIFLS